MSMVWAPDYITLEELRDFLRVPDDMTDDDAELAIDITAASRAVDRHCNRQFGSTVAEDRFYRAEWRPDRCRWVVVTDDMSAVPTAISVDGQAVTDTVLWPRNAAAEGRPYERLEFAYGAAVVPASPDWEVAVTAAFGWLAVPAPVKLATRLQASRFAARRDSPYGVAGSPDVGSEIRLLARLDPDVAVSLSSVWRPRRPR